MTPEYVTARSLTVKHGFFTRRGGVSQGAYASLNCSASSADAPEKLRQNRALVAGTLGIDDAMLVGVKQVHGRGVHIVNAPWPYGQGPEADALVTRTRGVALCVVTADCAPVLLADVKAGVVGAAHAGWRGACGGVLEAVVDAMLNQGAQRGQVQAAIGPCIGQASYEVAADMRDAVLANSTGAEKFFAKGGRTDRWHFDLSGYCQARLAMCDIESEELRLDTCVDDARFFSHRRRVLNGGGPIGHQISVVVA